MSDKKAKDAPREYWLEKDMFNQAYVYEFNPGGHRDIIHTIEMSAYRELEAKLAFTEEKLKQTQATVLETIKFRDEYFQKLDVAVFALSKIAAFGLPPELIPTYSDKWSLTIAREALQKLDANKDQTLVDQA